MLKLIGKTTLAAAGLAAALTLSGCFDATAQGCVEVRDHRTFNLRYFINKCRDRISFTLCTKGQWTTLKGLFTGKRTNMRCRSYAMRKGQYASIIWDPESIFNPISDGIYYYGACYAPRRAKFQGQRKFSCV